MIKVEEVKPEPKQLIAAEDFQNKWIDGQDDVIYHADKTAVGSSSLKKIEMVSLKTFRHSFFLSSGDKSTKAMKFGKLVHLAVLEGERFRQRYQVMPEFYGFTQKGERSTSSSCKEVKEKMAAWLADLPPGTIVTTIEERDKILGMIESILSHKIAQEFMSAGIAETSGYYRDPITGIRCKIRPDFMCKARRVIVDLKTAADCREEAFQWQVFGDLHPLWYDFSLAMYCEGFLQIEKNPITEAAWIAVEPDGAHEVAVHVMTPAVHDLGHIKYRRSLTALKQPIDSGNWPGRQASDDMSLINPPLSLMDKYGVTADRDLV